MRHFVQVAGGIDVVSLLAAIHRQPALWNAHTPRTVEGSPHRAVDDIWCRFRPFEELTSPARYAEPFIPAMYPAWHALPPLRPIVFGLMARMEAVQLGAVLITRVPPGKQVEPHTDKGRWHPEFFETKLYVPLMSNPACYNTCASERCVMAPGTAWVFDNLEMHSTVNDGDTDRVTLIIAMRCES